MKQLFIANSLIQAEQDCEEYIKAAYSYVCICKVKGYDFYLCCDPYQNIILYCKQISHVQNNKYYIVEISTLKRYKNFDYAMADFSGDILQYISSIYGIVDIKELDPQLEEF